MGPSGDTSTSSRISTVELLQQARMLAHSMAGVSAMPQNTKPRGQSMAPVVVSLEGGQQNLLYKLGDPLWEPKAAASRMGWTLSLTEKDERIAEEEFSKTAKMFNKHASAVSGAPRPDKRVQLQIYVRRGDVVLRDVAVFDVGLSQRSSLAHTVQQYAGAVCRDLGLDHQWFTPISMHVATLLAEATQAQGADAEFLPPLVSVVPQEDQGSFPRLEPVNPELDAIEQERVKRRQEKFAARKAQMHGSASTDDLLGVQGQK